MKTLGWRMRVVGAAVKRPLGDKKAKTQPMRTPTTTAATIRDPTDDWALSLVSNASLRPTMLRLSIRSDSKP